MRRLLPPAAPSLSPSRQHHWAARRHQVAVRTRGGLWMGAGLSKLSALASPHRVGGSGEAKRPCRRSEDRRMSAPRGLKDRMSVPEPPTAHCPKLPSGVNGSQRPQWTLQLKTARPIDAATDRWSLVSQLATYTTQLTEYEVGLLRTPSASTHLLLAPSATSSIPLRHVVQVERPEETPATRQTCVESAPLRS